MGEAAKEFDEWIREVKDSQFQEMLVKLNSKLYEWLDYKRSKGDKLSNIVTGTIKKVQDYIMLRSVEVMTELVELRTKVTEIQNYTRVLDEIAGKISRTSVGSATEAGAVEEPRARQRRDDFAVLVSPIESSMDVEFVKQAIKESCRTNKDLPTPGDVVITKNRQVILRMSSKSDTELISSALREEESLKDKVKINVPRKRRERMLILSVDPDIQEDTVKDTLESTLSEVVVGDGLYRGLTNKLNSQKLDAQAREVLQELYKETAPEVHIIKNIKTRNGKVNWLIDVDRNCRDHLIQRKRICVDFERYRVVDFVSITRCFKCQAFGHYAGTCNRDTHCVKCSGPHILKDCKETEVVCCNCYFENSSGDCSHRADSPDCPIYKLYRQSLLPDRS